MQNKNPAKNFEFRNLRKTDNLFEAAGLIYKTDPFIYPSLLGSAQTAQRVLPDLIAQDRICFGLSHLFCAVSDGHVKGLICFSHNDFLWNTQLVLNSFEKNKIPVPKYFCKAAENYFEKFSREADLAGQTYLICVCVDDDLRNLGLGRKLLNTFFDRHPSEEFSLHVLADNAPAIHLYRALGFASFKEVTGFSPAPPAPKAYFMVKSSNTAQE